MGRTDAHEGLEPPEVKPRKARQKTQKPRRGKLVIVESPAKARTVGRLLGKGYSVKASIGHIRDLLRSQLSVDVENNFEPKYRVPNEKREVVKGLKADAAKAKEVFLATDPDREGEAIAWHLIEAAEIDPERARRVAFHEITKPAVEEAFRNPRPIDMKLVDAQQARRILDRLVGYNLSPLLWRKVRGRLSAGRVQSVALRLVVDRERQIESFEPQEYWSLDAKLLQPEKPPAFMTRLVRIDEEKFEIDNEQDAQSVVNDMRTGSYQVSQVKRGQRTRKPPAPFITSTLQQAASRKHSYTARRTMALAQQLYEGIELGEGEPEGLITYMRTDSTQVSTSAVGEARQVIKDRFGKEFVPDVPPVYRKKSRGAQEAHEAIRPTVSARTPDDLAGHLTADQAKLYKLIWDRFIASQMKPAEYDTLTIEVGGRSIEHSYKLRVAASSLRFSGFMILYGDQEETEPGKKPTQTLESKMAQLPGVEVGDTLDLVEIFPEQHFTQPPPRYSDASLVRTLEEHGIGRPSTYAPIISTLRQRGYVERQKRRMAPTEIGEIVNDLIVDHFPDIVDLGFTARMEGELDEIAEGKRAWPEVIEAFYTPFAIQVEQASELMPEMKTEPEFLGRDCPECGSPLLIRHGRFGKFVGCSNFPTCRHTEPWLEKIGVACPEDGGDLVERRTRKGRTFYGCANYPECEFTSWKRPLTTQCPNCGGILVAENKRHARCLNCDNQYEQAQISTPEGDLA